MMGWYCPVKKCECDRDLQKNGPCLNCPWPSRQVPIEPQKTFKTEMVVAATTASYAAGCAAALQQCREAVANIKTYQNELTKQMVFEALAAAAIVEEK